MVEFLEIFLNKIICVTFVTTLQTLLNSKALLRDKERPLLRKVFEEENSKFDVEVVGQSAMKLIASRK